MTDTWNSTLEKFLRMDFCHQMIWLSKLSYIISMMARDTYEAGTDKVNKPMLLRRYNELLHRISSQQLNIAKGELDRMPEGIFFEMIAEEVTYLCIAEAVIKQLEE